LRDYDAHLRELRGLADGTRRGRLRIIGQFLQELFGGEAIEIGTLCPEDIRRFLALRLDVQRSASYAAQLATSLRCYFRYRATRGDPVGPLVAAILHPVQWKLATLPRALRPDEADRLLDAAGKARRWPKRGYAIVRCALDLGLRCGEIAHLRLDDIDWRHGTVTLKGTKSRHRDVLPLPHATGQALADYLQHERPASKHPSVFVRQTAGQEVPLSPVAVGKAIKRLCRRAGLPQASAHALRHTVASRLVANGGSLKEVADLLRHRSLESTLIYAKLDTPRLAAVALPWPGSQP
jgi:integrase